MDFEMFNSEIHSRIKGLIDLSLEIISRNLIQGTKISSNYYKTLKIYEFGTIKGLIDTDEDSKFVHRRKRPKVDTLFSSLFSDASERRV